MILDLYHVIKLYYMYKMVNFYIIIIGFKEHDQIHPLIVYPVWNMDIEHKLHIRTIVDVTTLSYNMGPLFSYN